jgi:hypothetical protein
VLAADYDVAVPSPPSSRNHIFISYRRDDARGASGRLYDWLRIALGRERVFRDVHSIGVGRWREKIDAALDCRGFPGALARSRGERVETVSIGTEGQAASSCNSTLASYASSPGSNRAGRSGNIRR